MIKTFKMRINEGQAAEYERRHNLLWPEMIDMIHEYGGKNYTIALDPETRVLFGYIELEDAARWDESANTAICRKWWDCIMESIIMKPLCGWRLIWNRKKCFGKMPRIRRIYPES